MKFNTPVYRVLFDLDGTLFDTQKFHAEAEVALLREFGSTISAEEITARYAGRPTEVVFKETLQCDDTTAKELARRKWEFIFPRAASAKPLCDIPYLLHKLQKWDIEYSIGTASPVKWARDILRIHGLARFFQTDAIIGGDMVSKGKPDPEIWTRAALRTPHKNCLVVEDGLAGVEGALTVGMNCALILPRMHEGALRIKSADDILHYI